MIYPYLPLQNGSGLCCCGLVLLPLILIIAGLYYFIVRKPSRGPFTQPKTYDRVGTPPEDDKEEEEETFQVDGMEHPSKSSKKRYSSSYSEKETDRGDKKVVKKSYNLGKKKGSKKDTRSFLDKLLDRKKVCEECGTELEYRDAYESYYCPNCRTFK